MRAIVAVAPKYGSLRRAVIATGLGVAFSSGIVAADTPLYLNPDKQVDDRVGDLVSRLTLEEKASLLNHRGKSVERFKIRSDGWNQLLNGVKWDRPTTLFPSCVAMSATWDPSLVHEVATVLSDEARAIYNGWRANANAPGEHKGLIYRGPVIDLARNPYWGRNHETWGEDPFLTGRMAVSYVRGLQGDNPRYLKVAATLKHFAVHNVADAVQQEKVRVSERMFREYWLAPFRDAVVDAKACSVMASYNAINGVRNGRNQRLLSDILKGEWGHQGFVVSDLGAIRQSGGALAYEDSVAESLMSGCDYSDAEYETYIPGAVRKGKLTEGRLNDAVARVLRVRFLLGEFDPLDKNPYGRISPSVIDSQRHRSVALRAAQKSIVLLKNHGNILPLDAAKLRKVAVIGPLADRVVRNNYNGKVGKIVSALEGIKTRVMPGTEVAYAVGAVVSDDLSDCKWLHEVLDAWSETTPAELFQAELNACDRSIDKEKALQEAVHLASEADVAVIFVGTDALVEQESNDRRTLGLTGNQDELVKVVLAVNPRTIVVQMSAGPLTVPWIAKHVPAMLQSWWSGEEGGNAIASVLFGDVNPAGRLPHTVYASEAQVPPLDVYDITHGYTYMYINGSPLFPFGHGLSYTTFRYGNLRVPTTPVRSRDNMTIEVEITNTGSRAGDEVVQLYVRQAKNGGVKRPDKQLHGFQRVGLRAGQTGRVQFSLPVEKLAFWDERTHSFVIEPGAYDVMLGSSSRDIRVHKKIVIM